MKFNAVFFDMDGVTIDSEPLWVAGEAEIMADYNYTWTQSDQIACLGGPLSRVGEYMSSKAGAPHDGQWFMNALISRQMEKLKAGAPTCPGALDLIAEFRKYNIPIALVSASPREIMDSALAGLPKGLFDFTISADDVKETKPNPEPYLTAAKRAGVDISCSLIIEDSLTGIKAGKASGAQVLAVPHLVTVQEEPRVKVVSSLVGLTPESISSLFSR